MQTRAGQWAGDHTELSRFSQKVPFLKPRHLIKTTNHHQMRSQAWGTVVRAPQLSDVPSAAPPTLLSHTPGDAGRQMCFHVDAETHLSLKVVMQRTLNSRDGCLHWWHHLVGSTTSPEATKHDERWLDLADDYNLEEIPADVAVLSAYLVVCCHGDKLFGFCSLLLLLLHFITTSCTS